MNPGDPPPLGDVSEEISALITTLHDAQQRLEVLTEGEVDTVADRDGRTFLLRRAQEQLRGIEAAKQEAIQEKLLESERRFSGMLANVELASVMLDLDAKITYCNDYLLRLSGWRLDEVVGRDWFEVFMPAELGDMKPVFAQLLKNLPEAWHRDNEIFTRSGERRMIRWNNSVLRSGAGDVIGTASIGEDITEQLRAQEELRRFGSAMDATADAIYLVDRASMRFIHVNDAACRMQSKTHEQLMELGPEGVLSMSRDELARTYDEIIASGVEAAPLELQRVRADGSKVWVEIRRQAQRSNNRWTIVTLVRDVTERKQSQQSIMREKNLISAMLDSLPGLFYLISGEGRFIRWNTEFESVSGYSADEIARMNPTDLFADSEKALVAEAIGRVFVTGDEVLEAGFTAKDKTTTPYHFTGRRVELDQAPHLIGMGIDITERKEALRKLHESEQRFRSLTKLSSDWFWEQDEEHRFRGFSGGDNIDGWGPDQGKTVGLRRWELSGAVPISSSWEEHRRVLEAHMPFRNFEYRRTVGDGKLQYVAASGEPIFEADGRFTGYRGVATEITKRKLAEHELQRFRAAMDISADAIVLVDRETMRYIDANQTLCDLAGLTREELIGRTPMDLMDENRESLERDYDAIIADSNSPATKVEGQYRQKDGRLVRTETRRRALRTENGWVMVGIVRDITDRSMAEEVLKKRAAELERFHRLSVGRELQMIELKKRVNELSELAGQKPPYDLAFMPARA